MLRFYGENYMQRRDFIALLGGIFSWPFLAHAQQKAAPVIGILNSFSPPANFGDRVRGPVHEGMTKMGFVEGQNIVWEYRWAEGHYDRLPALAADLVSRKVDVIVTIGGTPAAVAAKNATSTIPIVFTSVSNPVGVGLVEGLARPGGNVTGFSNIAAGLVAKEIEMICELVPRASAIAVLVNPNNPITDPLIRDAQEAAGTKGVKLDVMKAGAEGEIDAAFASLVQLGASGLVVDPDSFLSSRRGQIVALASRHAVPAIYGNRAFVSAGGLMSYGTDETAMLRQAGVYAGKILNGTKPADLPVQQPTTFELVVNLKTAKELGLTIPPLILARADEIIE
jgi:putative tryptophan/tyrosine transport system substrate-binding protein